MMVCSICTRVITAGERSAKFYVPVHPERITRAHVGCVRQLEPEATHEDLVPVVVR